MRIILYTNLMQKFENRECMVREGETQYWESITVDYMTEESDDESDLSRLVEHKIPWRSSGKLNVNTSN